MRRGGREAFNMLVEFVRVYVRIRTYTYPTPTNRQMQTVRNYTTSSTREVAANHATKAKNDRNTGNL